MRLLKRLAKSSLFCKVVSDQKLYKTMALHDLLNELDIIECFGHLSHKLYFGEVTKKQKSLFAALGVEDS